MSISVEGNNIQSRLKEKKKERKEKRFFISVNIIIIIIIIILIIVLIIFIVATSDEEELGKGIILSTLIQCIWSLTIEQDVIRNFSLPVCNYSSVLFCTLRKIRRLERRSIKILDYHVEAGCLFMCTALKHVYSVSISCFAGATQYLILNRFQAIW